MKCAGPELNIDAPCYPVWDVGEFCTVLDIGNQDRVLDVGGGHQPFSRADVIVDLSFVDADHRGGYQAIRGRRQKWVEANIEDLPFPDQSFDFVYCTHVLEHTEDPERACRELMRVASRGFIEVPRKFTEFLAGYPAHRWLVDWVNNTLVFEPKTFVEPPLTSFAHSMILNDPEFAERTERTWRHLVNVQLYWKKRFSVCSSSPEKVIDLSNRKVKGRAYLNFARDQLRWRAPATYAWTEAEIAVDNLPEDVLAWHLVAVYRALNGQKSSASLAFRKAEELAKSSDPSLQLNLRLWFGGGSLVSEGVVPGTDFLLNSTPVRHQVGG